MWFDRLLQGFIDTLLMVGVSSLIALPTGIALAVTLVTSGKGGIYEAPTLNRALGAFVNLFRSIPFLILMVALIPFTRLIVGTTYGVWAAVVPLTIAATLPTLAYRLARAVARSPAGHRRRFYHHAGDHDQFLGHGRCHRCRRPGGHRVSLWLPALRQPDHAHRDRLAGGTGGTDSGGR